MLLTNVLIIFIVFTIKIIASVSSLPVADREFSSVIYKTVLKVVKTCFKDQFNLLIMDEETSNYLNYIVDDLQFQSIIVIDEYFEINHSRNLNSNIATFILSTKFKQQFNVYLSKFRMTPWWNIESIFILIGALNDSCIDAQNLLTTAWNRKILSMLYFCYDSTNNNQIMLYTLNPFTNRAPDPWKFFKSINKPEYIWTLYSQPYHDEETICTNLMFDKTKNTNGYKLKAATVSSVESATIDPELFQTLKPLPFSVLIPSLFTALNVSVLIYGNESARLTDVVMNKSLKKLWKGDYDIYLDERPLEIMYNHVTDVLMTSDIAIVTQKRPYLKVEEKILLFFHPYASALIFIVIFISIMVLKINKNQKFIVALLEILSLFIGTGVRQPLNGVPIRIYLFGVFWLAIILSGTFQGNLASFLTKPKRLSVETVKDLKELAYQTYGTKTWLAVHQWRLSSLDQSRIHNLPNDSYDNHHMMNNTGVAIIGPASQLYKVAQKHKLHLSAPIGSVYAVWWTSADFLLKRKLNLMISHCKESGLIEFWNRKGYISAREKLIAEEINETRTRIRSIKFKDLLFAFEFWILGLGCSLLVLIMEIGNQLWLKQN